jgi:prepilin-type N-terminal cleavage/methylation domain-containing protein
MFGAMGGCRCGAVPDRIDAPGRFSSGRYRLGMRGFTLLEVMVAAGIFAVAFAGLYAAANHVMNLIRRAESSAVAQRNCLARIDQLRTAAWAKAVDPAYIATVMATPTGSETFTREVVSVYGATVPATVPAGSITTAEPTGLLYTVTRNGSSAPVISPTGFDATTITDVPQLNFRVLTEWTWNKRTAQRELSTIFSKSAAR